MSTRRATVDDLDPIMALERAAFARTAWSTAMMREELASAHTWYIVWEDAGRVRGYAGLRLPEGATDADVQTIALAADARGGGRGRALLESLLAEAARRGVREVFLDVRDDNAVAQRLYESEGFTAIGRRPNYYAAEGVDGIAMRLDLGRWAAAHPPETDGDTAFGRAAREAPNSAASAETRAQNPPDASDAGAAT